MQNHRAFLISIIILLFCNKSLFSQPMPSEDEKIPFLSTFGPKANISYGDDDHMQIYFFVVPENSSAPFYIRVFDPDISGLHDEIAVAFNTKTKFSFYGGKGAHSEKDAQNQNPKGNFKSGVFLTTKTFGSETDFDGKWYEFGPFNPKEGELQPKLGGYVFKMIVEGLEGDDGNLYKFFMSTEKDKNSKVEGANSFCYEYSFRLNEKPNEVAHVYPYISQDVITCEIHVFDFDDAGIIRVVSIAKKGEVYTSKTEGVWNELKFPISQEEINTSLDVQLINKKIVHNNNVAIYITNQYGQLMPFFAAPIGGVPKYKYKIGVKPSK